MVVEMAIVKTSLKRGIRILAIDDSSFCKSDSDALVVGVLGREGVIEGIISFRVKVNGSDAAEQIIRRVGKSKFLGQIRVVAVHGATLAGLNIVDAEEISDELGLPVICIVKKKRLCRNPMKTDAQ
jgi:endonuclease V-like protein UPF0215 family